MADGDSCTCPQLCDPSLCPPVYPFVSTTVEAFDRFNSKGVMFSCGVRVNIPRYLATNFQFDSNNMVSAGKSFVMNVLNNRNGEIVPVAIYEG